MKLFFAALALAAPAALNAQTISAADPQSIVRAMQAAGYRAELTRDPQGDPLIRSSTAAANFSIFFYGCTKGASCSAVQFYAGWQDKASLNAINEWNRKHRYGRAYLDDQGEANIEYDVNMGGAPFAQALFKSNLEAWELVLQAFTKFLNEQD